MGLQFYAEPDSLHQCSFWNYSDRDWTKNIGGCNKIIVRKTLIYSYIYPMNSCKKSLQMLNFHFGTKISFCQIEKCRFSMIFYCFSGCIHIFILSHFCEMKF